MQPSLEDTHTQKINPGAHRPTWAEIDLDALAHNFQIVRRQIGPEIKIMGVVKANAYGHGAVECARRLAQAGAAWFGVATPEEGIELRTGGIMQPILCLGGFWEGQASLCLEHALTPVVYRLDAIAALDSAARSIGTMADVHLKIDTGMGRLGVRYDDVAEFVDQLKRFTNIRVDGLMTHFAAADDLRHESFTLSQVQRFNNAVELFRARGFNPTYCHLANSAGIFSQPSMWGNMVRPGGILYGLWRDVLPASGAHDFIPVMSLRSQITLLKRIPPGETVGYGCTYTTTRDTLIATLPIGYNDG